MEYKIGNLKRGFVVHWDEDGKRRRFRLAATNRGEAQAEALRVWEAQKVLSPKTLTSGDLQKMYRNHLGDRVTGKQSDDVWKQRGPALAHYTPDQINDTVMKEFLAKRQAISMARRGKPLSNGTLWIDVNIAQCILNYGVRKNHIPRCIQLDKPVKPAPKDRWLETHEIKSMLHHFRSVPHLYTAALLMLGTAGRVTSVLELTWDRVDFNKDWIDLRIDPGMPAKGRARVPMNSGLKAHLLSTRQHSDCAYVVSYRDQKLASISKGFRTLARKANLPGVSPHVLRHTAAVHMVANGSPMHKVSQ